MKRIVVFALVLNAALLGVIAHQLVAIAGGGAVATQNGDTNGDGNRDITDAIYYLSWLFQGGAEPVAIAQEGGGLTPEQAEMLSHMSIEQLPIDDDGTTAKAIRFSGVNVQVVNGTGVTYLDPTPGGFRNGLGNLIIGYQEMRIDDGDDDSTDTNDRTGSHNLVVGRQNNYSLWGGQVVGDRNMISGHLSTVSGGHRNTASGGVSTVAGGQGNTASSGGSTVSGGFDNSASGWASTAGGGVSNTAAGAMNTVSGGEENTASNDYSTVSGGFRDTADGSYSTVSGGELNMASGEYSTATGGRENRALSLGSTVGGGYNTLAGESEDCTYSVEIGDGRF